METFFDFLFCSVNIADNDTDRSIWWHFLVVHIPDEFDPQVGNNGYVLIDGGGNDSPDSTPDTDDTFVLFTGIMAASTKT